MVVVLTGVEQDENKGMSEAVKREITQGLQERHGLDKGIAIAGTCKFFDFETSEEIDLQYRSVRCIACRRRVPCVALRTCRPHPRMSLTLHAATAEG